MEKFDPNPLCIKCGLRGNPLSAVDENDFPTKWWKENESDHEVPATPFKPERISRTCPRCGYSWDEAPLNLDLTDPEPRKLGSLAGTVTHMAEDFNAHNGCCDACDSGFNPGLETVKLDDEILLLDGDIVVFKEGNGIPYLQDFRFPTGLPPDAQFTFTGTTGCWLNFVADGYGLKPGTKSYGNGSIAIAKEKFGGYSDWYEINPPEPHQRCSNCTHFQGNCTDGHNFPTEPDGLCDDWLTMLEEELS